MELFKLLGTIAISGADSAKNDIDNVSGKAGKLGETLTTVGGKISDFGGKLTAGLSVPLTALGALTVKAAADAKAANSQFEQTFGELQGTASDAINRVAEDAGILNTRLRGVGTSIYAFAKSSGADSAEAMSLMEEALKATADAAAYYDRSLDDTSESLMSFLKGNFANDAALGVSCTEVTRNAKAVELFGQKYNDLSEIQKQQTLLKMVTDAQKLSGAMGQAARESDGFENVIGNMKESATLLAAEFGEVLLPKVIEIMQKATEMLRKFNEMDEGTKKLILTIGGIAIAIGPVLTVLGSLISGIGAFITIASTVGPLLAAISAPVAIAIAAITALIAAGVLLYKNWDVIKEKCSELWNNTKEKFNNIKKTIVDDVNNAKKNAINGFNELKTGAVNKVNELKTNVVNRFNEIKNGIQEKIESAREKVRSEIEKIKGFFNFEWSLPKIKLPHFSLSGEFSLNPPSVPKFSIDWYKKAMDDPMIMNSPTAFGINANGQIMAGGEAGSEVVSGTETLMNMIGTVVAAQNEGLTNLVARLFAFLQEYLPEMANMQLVMDSGAVIGELAPGMDKALGRIAYRKERGV